MTRRISVVLARFRALLRREATSLRHGSVALTVSVLTSLLAGLVLGSITDTLEQLPGLLLMIPAAVGLRGNIAGALASRLATSIHAGTFRVSRRLDTLVGQNFAAAAVLSIAMSFVVALLAKGAAIAFGVRLSISLADFVAISIVGGLLASVVVIAVTALVASLSARFEWDLDNVAAPVVTAAGDLVTLPALWVATHLATTDVVTPVVAWMATGLTVLSLALTWRSRHAVLRAIVRQSVPILAVAALVSIVAGVTMEKQLERLAVFPALLILIPPFLGLSGALGGIFSSRLATKLHLGLVEPGRMRLLALSEDLVLIAAFALPVFLAVGAGAYALGELTGLAGPGLADMMLASVLAGTLATAAALLVGFVGTVSAFRLGLDPDNYAIPVAGSALDLLGAVAVVLALTAVGVL